MDPKNHWDQVYRTVAPDQMSWFQPEPAVSLELIRHVAPDPASSVIDVGGGTSALVEHLVLRGYHALTVLDLSPTALAAARRRLGDRGTTVTWLEADVLTATLPASAYDVWHDRAVFHFLTDPEDRRRYVAQVRHALRPGGFVLVAAFGPDGPTHCSGLPVVRYSPERLHAEFGRGFELLESAQEEHHTPSGKSQQFIYCVCRMLEPAAAV